MWCWKCLHPASSRSLGATSNTCCGVRLVQQRAIGGAHRKLQRHDVEQWRCERRSPAAVVRHGYTVASGFVRGTHMNPDYMLVHQCMRSPGASIEVVNNPVAQSLAAHITRAERRRVVLEFRPGVGSLQGGGTIQGGVAAVMLDFAMAFSAMSVLGPNDTLATASLTVSFLKAMLPGRYEARGRVEHQGRRLCFAQSELIQIEGDVMVASATSVISVRLASPTSG